MAERNREDICCMTFWPVAGGQGRSGLRPVSRTLTMATHDLSSFIRLIRQTAFIRVAVRVAVTSIMQEVPGGLASVLCFRPILHDGGRILIRDFLLD